MACPLECVQTGLHARASALLLLQPWQAFCDAGLLGHVLSLERFLSTAMRSIILNVLFVYVFAIDSLEKLAEMFN
jgi:hypothetical protein